MRLFVCEKVQALSKGYSLYYKCLKGRGVGYVLHSDHSKPDMDGAMLIRMLTLSFPFCHIYICSGLEPDDIILILMQFGMGS